MGVSEDQRKAVKEALLRAIETSDEKQVRGGKAKLIEEMRSEIKQLQAKGWTYKQIAAELKPTLGASPELIRQVVMGTLPNAKGKKAGSRHRKVVVQVRPSPAVEAEQVNPASVISQPHTASTPSKQASAAAFTADVNELG